MQYYDKSKIGKLIARGGEHTVYEYGPGEVIKFSNMDMILGRDAYDIAKKEYKIVKKYFGDLILDTRFLIAENNTAYVKIQDKISGHFLSTLDLQNTTIAKEFVYMYTQNQKFVLNEKVHIDLVGKEGVFSGQLANIFVLPNNTIVIIESMLFFYKKTGIVRILFWIFWSIGIWRQNIILENMFKLAKNTLENNT